MSEDFDPEDIEIGDYVDFGIYGKLYVVSDNGDRFWVTDRKRDRGNRNASGWSIRKAYVHGIIESYYDAKEEDTDECEECGRESKYCQCE